MRALGPTTLDLAGVTGIDYRARGDVDLDHPRRIWPPAAGIFLGRRHTRWHPTISLGGSLLSLFAAVFLGGIAQGPYRAAIAGRQMV